MNFLLFTKGNGTVKTLLDNLEVLERVALLLDRETQGMENWHHFAWSLGLSEDECQAIEINLTKEYPSPTTIMLKIVVEAYPELKMQDFVRMLVTMKRIDVVKVLEKYCCGKHCIIQSLHNRFPLEICCLARLKHLTLFKSKFHPCFSKKLFLPFLFVTVVI